MKTKIVAAALILISLSLNSFAFGPGKLPAIKELSVNGKFQKIAVGSNIKLVLVPANNKNGVQVTGRQDKVNDIMVTVHNNTLMITSNKSLSSGIVTVYVPASDLSYIELARGASLSGEGSLTFKDLTVLLNVDCRMDLVILGKIHVTQTEDCDMVYEKNEVSKVYVKR